MTKVLMKGNEALGEAAIRAGCIHFFGYPITPADRDPRVPREALRGGRRHVRAGRERGRLDQHDLRGRRHGREVPDVVLVAGHHPDGRGHELHRGLRAAVRDHQHHARRPRPRRHPAGAERLLAGDAGATATATTA